MTAVLIRLRSELRIRWRAWLGLALLLALAGGAATAAATGARRTESAYPRFVAAEKGPDLVTGGFPEKIDPEKALAAMERLPEVKEWSRIDAVSYGGILPTGQKLTVPQFAAVTDLQSKTGFVLDRFKVLSGRLFDLKAPDEALVDFGTAEKYGLRLGSVVKVIIGDPGDPKSKLAPVRIVGIVAGVGSFPAVGISASFSSIAVTPAFASANHITPSPGDASLVVRLKHGAADLGAFLHDKEAAGYGDVDVPVVGSVLTSAVQRSIRFESQALWALAVLIGLASLAILGQALARQVHSDTHDFVALRAVGLSRNQLAALGLLRSAGIGIVAALLAVPVAILLSPLTPIGLARIAEPNPGIWVDGAALAIGAALVLVSAIGASALPAFRVARAATTIGGWSDRERPSMLAGALGRASSSPAAATGLRMALEPGRGRTAVPVRSAIFGTALSVAALAASVLFATSLHHVLVTPRLSGFTWNAFVSDEVDPSGSAKTLRADRRLGVYSRGGFINVKIGGESLFGLVTNGKGPAHPIISEGRPPVAADEVALGVGTMRATHTSIGHSIVVQLDDVENPAPPVRMRIVGTAIMPPAPFGITRPGTGAAFSLAGWTRVDPTAIGRVAYSPFLVTYAPGVSEVTGLAAIHQDAPNSVVIPADRPGDVSSLARISNLPVLLAGLLALMAIGTVAHTLVTSTRRRRRDLAILKTLGFARGQLAAAVAWQATALAGFALLIGLPVGIAAGRWGWRFFADQLGVLSVPIVPMLAVLIFVPSALVLANLIAALPGRSAARTHAALVLRSE